MNSPLHRPGLRPPQPVDLSSPQWVAMYYQWIIDCLVHLDECMDKTQTAHEETRTELSTWMTAAATADNDFAAKLAEHVREHGEIDRVEKARKSVWIFQWETVKDIGRFATSGAVTALVVVVLKATGII